MKFYRILIQNLIEGYINCIKKGLIPYSGDKYHTPSPTQPITTTTTSSVTTEIDVRIDSNRSSDNNTGIETIDDVYNDSLGDLFDNQSLFFDRFSSASDTDIYCLPCDMNNRSSENLTTISDSSNDYVLSEQPVVFPTNSILQGWMQHMVKVPKVNTSHLQPTKRSKASVSLSAIKQVFGFKANY